MANTIPWAGSVPYGSFDERKANALKNAGGDANSSMFKQWMSTYGAGGTNPSGTPFGAEAGNFNQFMTNQSVMPFIQNLPGYQSMVGQRSENTGDMLRGEIPGDVVNQIAQQSAERGIGSGVQGSPNSSTALLRALGLTSLDMMGKGSQELSQSISDTPVPELFNPASLWSPMQMAGMELNQAQAGKATQEADAARKAAAAAWNRGSDDGTYISMWGGPFQKRF